MDLRAKWLDLCRRVCTHDDVEGDGALTFGMIETLYAHPERAYHNLGHVDVCLGVFEGVRLLAEDREAVEFALWMHDCVFDAARPDNEARSADASGMLAALLGARPGFAERVRELIMVTRHDRTPRGGDEAVISDVDLSILGATPDAYAEYRRAIRAEFAFASEEQFAHGRHAFLGRMLDRDRIYATGLFRDELEARARENMDREMREIETGPWWEE
jgi:predicted metal-dependent HD superfamily phosphohydrolase